MDESKIREYVRRELLREYYGAYMSSKDLYDILDSVKDVWEVTKVAIKDVLSSTVYVYEVAVAVDGEEIEKAREKFKSNKEKIIDEYEGSLRNIREKMGADFHILTFLAAPGPYLLAQSYDKGPSVAKDVIRFLAEAGLEVDMPAQSVRGDPEEAEMVYKQAALDSMFGKRTSYTKANFTNLSGQIENALNKIFGVRSTATEGVEGIRSLLREEKGSSGFEKAVKDAQKDLAEILKEKLEGFDMSKIVDPADQKKMLDLKKAEAKEYINILNAPTKFVVAMGKAKSMDDVRKATDFLKGTPYKVDGIGSDEEKKIASQAKQLMKDAKDKKKVGDILKAAGSKVDPSKVTDEELYDSCVVVLTRNAIESIAKVFEDPEKAGERGKKLIEEIKSQKEKLLKEFMGATTEKDLELMSKTKEGKLIAEVMKSGAQAIKSAGLRPSKSV